MKKLVFGLLAMGMAMPVFSQVIKTEELSEVTVTATNYKYLNNVANEEPAAIPVELLERKAAAFDPRSSEYYQDDFDLYNISFFIPEGKVLAAYDSNGKILRTIERYKDINLPSAVKKAILERFPKWKMTKNIYVVNYRDAEGAKKKYTITLENGKETLKVKTDENGNFL
jgi:hypothetical protein